MLVSDAHTGEGNASRHLPAAKAPPSLPPVLTRQPVGICHLTITGRVALVGAGVGGTLMSDFLAAGTRLTATERR